MKPLSRGSNYGDVVVTDQISAHRSNAVAETIKRLGARVELLLPYSPDLTPAEHSSS